MGEVCAFCQTETTLRKSHVLPAFVFRWLKKRSCGKGHLRSLTNPNVRVQDGLKFYWLCEECEDRFNKAETLFANRIFNLWKQGQPYKYTYESWLLIFCVSISWRVLKYCRSHGRGGEYSKEQLKLLDLAETRWKLFLLGEVPHPAEFEQHIVVFDLINEADFDDLPSNFNRFLTGHVTLDIVGSDTSLMTYAKMGPFNVFGIIQSGSHKWEGTRVSVRNGILKSGRIGVPMGLLPLLKQKAQLAEELLAGTSQSQQEKIDSNILRNRAAFAASDQFKAILADINMFGADAALGNKKK